MLIDAFTFFNEKELVELRIKYLDPIVDFFVIVEANVTHQGKKKEWNFPEILKKNLKEFSNKIQYHKINIDISEIKNEDSWIIHGVEGDDSWRIENYQRNFIKKACSKFSDEDILILSDVDEIPSKEKLSFVLNCNFKKIAPVAFEQHLFHLDCNFLRQESWRGSILTTLQICNKYSPQELRNARNKISHFSDSGWSFSSFGGPKAIKEKFAAFAHKEYNKDEFTNLKHIANCQKNGSDLFKRNIKTLKIKENFFPKDLLELMKKKQKFYFGFND